MDIEVIHSVEQLSDIREDWEKLWNVQTRPNPYNNWAWIKCWIEAVCGEKRLCILSLRDVSGNLIGIAPFQQIPVLPRWLFAVTFIGQETSISPDLLSLPGRENEICEKAIEYISGRGNIAGLYLKIAEPAAVAAFLKGKLHVEPYNNMEIENYSQRPIIHLPDDYETFLGTLSTKMRQEMRVARKKLEELPRVEFCHDDRRIKFETRLKNLFDLNDARWGVSGGRRMYERHYGLLAANKLVKIFALYIDGRPAAALSALVGGDTLYAELAGIHVDAEKRHLGKYFYGSVIGWAMENGFKYFDFSSGNEEYKMRFNPILYPKYRITLSGSKLKKTILENRRVLGRRIRWLREPALV